MAEFGRVEVKSIRTDEPRSNFSEAQLDQLADLLLKGEGALRPVIVKQIDYANYKLIDGTLSYYAAVRAQEKDARRGEMVNAFIIKLKEDETLAKQQIEALNHGEQSTTANRVVAPVVNPNDESKDQKRPGEWISSFESRLSDTRHAIDTKTQELERRLSKLEKISVEKHVDLLALINTLAKDELAARLVFYGADKAKAKAIVDARNRKESGKFTDYEDLLDSTKGLAAKGLLSMIDRFRIHNQ